MDLVAGKTHQAAQANTLRSGNQVLSNAPERILSQKSNTPEGALQQAYLIQEPALLLVQCITTATFLTLPRLNLQ